MNQVGEKQVWNSILSLKLFHNPNIKVMINIINCIMQIFCGSVLMSFLITWTRYEYPLCHISKERWHPRYLFNLLIIDIESSVFSHLAGLQDEGLLKLYKMPWFDYVLKFNLRNILPGAWRWRAWSWTFWGFPCWMGKSWDSICHWPLDTCDNFSETM